MGGLKRCSANKSLLSACGSELLSLDLSLKGVEDSPAVACSSLCDVSASVRRAYELSISSQPSASDFQDQACILCSNPKDFTDGGYGRRSLLQDLQFSIQTFSSILKDALEQFKAMYDNTCGKSR